MNAHFRLMLVFALSISISAFFITINAQVYVNETFKTNIVNSYIKLGNGAYLTASTVDPIDDGWLRLTNTTLNQKGYAYIDAPFPSTLGAQIDFEYKSWRDASAYGADGFSVFLFDATATFKLGGSGGPLGYSPGGAVSGLAGGYIGIGFDEFGNFSKGFGGPGQIANSIVLRGPTTNLQSTTNWYLTGVQLQPDITSNVNSICYPSLITTRPTDALFYRKVKINIIPTGNQTTPKYTVIVSWRTSPVGNDIALLKYETTNVPPSNLKLGFAASTGSYVNYHEIRNLKVSIPVGISVYKTVDKATPKVGDKLTYTVNVQNLTIANVNNILLSDTLKLNGGAITDNFSINSIVFNNNGTSENTATGYTNAIPVMSGFTNPFNTTLSLKPNSSVSFKITGTIKNDTSLEGATLLNAVNVDASQTGFDDEDLIDNYATAISRIAITTPDLQIKSFVDKLCADTINGNTYTLLVSNISVVDINKANPTQIIVTDTIPTGFKIVKITAPSWSVTQTSNVLKFSRNGALLAGASYDPIVITVKPSNESISWINTSYVTSQNSINEIHFDNNKSSIKLNHSTQSTRKVVACNSYTAPDGAIYTDSGVKTAIIPNYVGCDSIITINLTVNKQSIPDSITVKACDSYTAPDGTIFTDSGIKKVVIPSVAGCDSTIIINLTVSKSSTKTIDVTSCDSYIAPDGVTYTDSGVKSAVIPNVLGCDSTITINLTVNHSENITQTKRIFTGESYSINGNVYDKEGTYTDVLKTKLGCDSVVVTNIKYTDIPNTITPNGDGIHDTFMEGYHVKIYNRNGISLFEGTNGWNGTHNDRLVSQGTYFFILYLNSSSETKEGYVTVVR